MTMSWYEHAIRRYEHRRWTTDDNRMVRPFEWGLEHINGRPGPHDPREFLGEYASEAIARSALSGSVPGKLAPGCNRLTITRPSSSDTNEALTNQPIVLAKMRPNLAPLPM